MSLQLPTSPVQQTSAQQKLQSRNAAKRFRDGMPQLRHVLREKFRQRIKDARCNSYQGCRNVSQNVDIKELLRQELAELEYDISLEDDIYRELLDDFDRWFVEQQEAEESYLLKISDSTDVICPVCQKDTLQLHNEICQCNCGLSFTYKGDLEQLNMVLQSHVNLHEQQCQQQINFYVEPQSEKTAVLNGICEACDFFCSL